MFNKLYETLSGRLQLDWTNKIVYMFPYMDSYLQVS